MPEFEFSSRLLGEVGVLLLAVSLHESAHAFMANWLGDRTGKELGRVTLNPLPHLHPLLSVLLPAYLILSKSHYLFAAGRPVPVSVDQLKKPGRDFALVALAGPATNVLLALLLSGAWIFLAGGDDPILSHRAEGFYWVRFGIKINVLLACFNLIPIPPLDGSRLLAFFLPGPLRRAFYALDALGFLLILALVITGVMNTIVLHTYQPVFDWWYDLCLSWL
ncbi:MAG: site-2 protease family protein [Planctomycetota bacterium]